MSQLVYRIFPSGLTTFPLYSRLSTFFFLNSHFFNCRTIQKNKTQDSRTNSSSFDSIESLTTPSSQTSWLNRLCVTDWSYTVDRKVLSSSSRLTRDGRARVSVDGRHNKLMSQQQWFMEASIGRLNYRMDDKKKTTNTLKIPASCGHNSVASFSSCLAIQWPSPNFLFRRHDSWATKQNSTSVDVNGGCTHLMGMSSSFISCLYHYCVSLKVGRNGIVRHSSWIGIRPQHDWPSKTHLHWPFNG